MKAKTTRTCKKCGVVCENMTALIAHYLSAHNIDVMAKRRATRERKTNTPANAPVYKTAVSRITALQKETRDSLESLRAERETKHTELNEAIDQRSREITEYDAMIKRYEALLLQQ